MFAFLKRRAVLVVIGLVLLSLFIWFAGPYFGFVINESEFRPLGSDVARLVLIALLVGAWIASVLVKRMQANRKSDKLMAAVVEQSRTDSSRPSAEAQLLRERFEEAVATLRQKRRSGHTLYELPWYVFIGAPGSGKTTALKNSGLKFPVEQRAGKDALRGVGGTRNCDWWFTDDAVFLDTAGRYTTQDSDANADSAAWTEFLGLLRKYRTRRPVNGIILTISAQDLMVQSHSEREAYVAAARRRLDELNRELHIQLPVYLFVTKCDLIAGFTEYFNDQDHEGRVQVWGTTFPYDLTTKGEAANRFPEEFDALVTRLNERLFLRLEEERDARRRARIFGFPLQVAALRTALTEFVSDTFGSTRFDKRILLRGVYFTSGTQEGTPIDRLLGALSRKFALASDAVVAPGRGKAYFIERLLKDVLFQESGLAGVNRRLEVQKAIGQMGAYIAIVVVAIVGVILLTVSYSRNRSYIEQVDGEVARLGELPEVAAGASLESVLPRLDAVRAVVDTAWPYGDDPPWSMRWGLYQGDSLGNAARDGYARELDSALLTHVAARIKERLVDYAGQPETLYEYLKAYLMLGDHAHLDKAQLAYITDIEWRETTDPDTAAALSKHFNSLLEYEGALREIDDLDQELIAQARSTIRQASLPAIMYRQLRLSSASDTSRGLRLDLAAGVGVERVLRRKSGVPLNEPVLGLYTAPVFKEITERDTDDIVKQFAADRWVWGEEGAPRVSTSELRSQFIDLYEKDYIAAWDAILQDIEPVPMSSLPNTKEVLALMAGSTSPLRGLLKVVDEHTYLVQPPDAQAPAGGIRGRIGGFLGGRAGALLKQQPDATMPGSQVTAHFAEIHQLVTGDVGNAPIDAVLGKLRQIQQKLEPIGEGVGQTGPLDPATVNSLGELVTSVKRDAAPMPPVVGSIVTQVADRALGAVRSVGRGSLNNSYVQDVVRECTAITSNRYPFAPGSTVDVPVEDFGRLFGYNGIFDTFFKNELEALVDTSRATWSWRTDASGAPVGTSVAMLRQFEAARRIRDTFFRAGAQTPEIRFRVTPTFLDQQTQRFLLELDGLRIEYRHGPERSTQALWPGETPGPAVATFEERGGGRPNVNAQGQWAWFRLMDMATVERESDVSYVFAFEQGGHRAQIRIEATTIRNPFGKRDLQQFRCES
jgi:type VI secretion system protein ImpL